MAPKVSKSAKKKKTTAARPPKAAPKSLTKAAELDGPRPLSMEDYRFCVEWVQTGKQVDAYRAVWPDMKDPHGGAHRMMKRPEIREHIRAIYAEISKQRQKAAEVAARATMLTLQLADDRLTEILQQPRKTRGEMLSRDVKQLLIPGATMVISDEGEAGGFSLSPEAQRAMTEGAPVEDADLLKAVKLAYERKGGIIKAETAPVQGPVVQMLYTPKWRGKTIEGQ